MVLVGGFPCVRCPRVFKTKGALHGHEYREHGITRKLKMVTIKLDVDIVDAIDELAGTEMSRTACMSIILKTALNIGVKT